MTVNSHSSCTTSAPFVARGAFTALVTPFNEEGGLDDAAYQKLVAFQVEAGIDGLVPCGTTGESPTLNWHEHDHVIEVCIHAVAGRVSVLAGTGSNNTAEAIRGTHHARAAGASAALLVDCYYNGPSSLELRRNYYEKVLAAVPEIPIVPYVIPGRSGCALSAADLAILHQEHSVRVPAVKQATGDLARMQHDRELAGPSLAILSGDDALTLSMMRHPGIGCAGMISVMTNLVPAAMKRMVTAQQEQRTDEATTLAAQLTPLLSLVGCSMETTRTLPSGREVHVIDTYRNPVPVKTMMAGLGMLRATPFFLRQPLGLMSRPAIARCREALRQVHHTNPEILRPIENAFEVNVQQRIEDDSVWNALTDSSVS